MFSQSFWPSLVSPAAVVMGDDFNCVMTQHEIIGPRECTYPSVRKLKALLRASTLDDILDVLNAQTSRFTSCRVASGAIPNRIYTSNDFRRGAENYEEKGAGFFDSKHLSCAFSLAQEQSVRHERQNVWRMSNSMLGDKDSVKVIEDHVV